MCGPVRVELRSAAALERKRSSNLGRLEAAQVDSPILPVDTGPVSERLFIW